MTVTDQDQTTTAQTPEGLDSATATAAAAANTRSGDAAPLDGAQPDAEPVKTDAKDAAKADASAAVAAPVTDWTDYELKAVDRWSVYTAADLAEMPPANAKKVVEQALRSESKAGRNWSEIGRAMQRSRQSGPGKSTEGDNGQPASQAQTPFNLTRWTELLGEESANELNALVGGFVNRIDALEGAATASREDAQFQEIDGLITSLPDAETLGFGKGAGYRFTSESMELRRRAELAANIHAISTAREQLQMPISIEDARDLALAAMFPNRRTHSAARVNPTATSRAGTTGATRARTPEERTMEALAERDAKNPVKFFTDG